MKTDTDARVYYDALREIFYDAAITLTLPEHKAHGAAEEALKRIICTARKALPDERTDHDTN